MSRIKEIKEGFGDCDWLNAILNQDTVDDVLWLINRVEELEDELGTNQDSLHKAISDRVNRHNDNNKQGS